MREAVGGDTYGTSESISQTSKSSGRMQGPTLPSPADLQLAREDAASYANMTYLTKRKRERGEDKERVDDLVGPKEVGREGLLERKRMRREGDRAFREVKEDGGLEVSEDVLMGGNSSFKERYTSTCLTCIEAYRLSGLPNGTQPGLVLRQRREQNVIRVTMTGVSVQNNSKKKTEKLWKCLNN